MANDRILTTLRCAHPDCRQNVIQVHFAAPAGVVRVLECPACKGSSEFTSTATGVVAAPIERERRF